MNTASIKHSTIGEHLAAWVGMLCAVLTVTSCANSYNIQGSSNISTLDGHKLYLKIVDNEELKDIDSCDVVHGAFAFAGSVDSTCMANIYMRAATS